MTTAGRVVLEAQQLDLLFLSLQERGYQTIGPRVRDGAVVYDTIASTADLPVGWTDEQTPGRYRLDHDGGGTFFGYGLGPQAWKRLLHPPTLTLWRARREEAGFRLLPTEVETPVCAFIGVRPCELAAIAIQDRVFLGGPYADPHYRARREAAFLVTVNCGRAGGTCFCASLQTGPRARTGYDLALTELLRDGRHEFLLEVGSARGAELAARLPQRAARKEDLAAADEAERRAIEGMGRVLDRRGLPELLYARYDHRRWDEVADRCLACANCTMVCPTCFCTTLTDASDLTGEQAERIRCWDSCFTLQFSRLHGGSARASGAARYRQWLTHKLGTWQDQFGSSGCVGCGRCITWCPAGIDLTEEARALRLGGRTRKATPA